MPACDESDRRHVQRSSAALHSTDVLAVQERRAYICGRRWPLDVPVHLRELFHVQLDLLGANPANMNPETPMKLDTDIRLQRRASAFLSVTGERLLPRICITKPKCTGHST